MKQTIRRFLPVAVALIATVWVFRTDVVGYVSSGHAWATNQVPYYVNPSNIYVSNSAAISAFQAGALPWTSQTLANIQLVYAGTTNGSSITLNNKNEVFFRNDSSSYVAETYWWYDGTGHLVDADMMLHENNHFYAGSGCTGAGVYIEDVAVHEFGHALGLNHSTVLGATMYPTMPGYCDMTQMSLESDDISGIESLYPPTSTSKNTAPTVSISAPGNGASFANGATISFAGSASDSQDGNVTSSIAWTSSIDGAIGSGGSFSRVLSAGSHVITASVRDSGGLTGTKQITISVAAASSSSSSSSGPSPDGTMVPTTASQIVDNAGNIWTIGSNQLILMTAPNGSQSANGSGSKIYWKSSTIYVYGTDGNWYQWTGSGWRNVGSATPGGTTTTTSTTTVSPDGTMVPTTASQIMDNAGNIWTIGSNQLILMTAPNGVQTTNGTGSKIYWKSSTIYVYGTDGNWYQWTGSGWRNVGSATPGGTTTTTSTTTVSPDGTMVPTTASQILDSAGNIWTIGSNQLILMTAPNGSQSANGTGSKIYWKSSTIYVYGTDGNWYQWTGSGWRNVGSTTPGGTTTTTSTTTVSPDGTMVPTTASQILDNAGNIWTIGSNQMVLVTTPNGVQSFYGSGSKIYWKSSTIYVYGTDANWYRWTGSGWVNIGPIQP